MDAGDEPGEPSQGELDEAALEELRAITRNAHAERRRVEDEVARAERARQAQGLADVTPTYVSASPTPPATAPAAPSSGSDRDLTPCAWCGQDLVLGGQQSTVRCRACGKSSALGRCPNCGHVGMARLTAGRAVCGSCGHASAARSRLEGLATAGATVAKAGCALTALVWVLIPLLIVLVAVIVALFSR